MQESSDKTRQTVAGSDSSFDASIPNHKRIIEGIQDGLCTIDKGGCFTFVNDIVCSRSGYPREWFLGKNCLDLVQPDRRGTGEDLLRAVLEREETHVMEMSYSAAKGARIWIEITASPIFDSGRSVGLVAITRDITKRKKAEDELNHYRNDLEAAIKKRTAELSVANEQLQKEIGEHKKTEKALRDSEDLYRAIFQNTGTAMVIMEEDTTISLVNRESVKFVGLTPRELEGKRKAIEFVAPRDFQFVWDYHELRLKDASKPPRGYEFTILDKFGNPKEIYMTIELIPGKRKIIASFLDISDRKKVERALKESEEKYRNIFENVTEGIYQTTVDGKILDANPAFARILGYESPAQIMKTVGSLACEMCVDPDRREELKNRLERDGVVTNFEVRCRRLDGSKIWLATNARAVRNGAGSLQFFEGTVRDITERKRMQADIENKSRSLEETNAALRVLLKHRERDNEELEEKILVNIRELVIPYIERLKASPTHDRIIVDIVEANLNDILSPFIRVMTARYGNFTPKEIQVVNLMKKGKTTKEISQILNLSPRTIDIHRASIRRKLMIVHKKVNLQSYLLSLS
jgi:PAS domain S-box-containing protein